MGRHDSESSGVDKPRQVIGIKIKAASDSIAGDDFKACSRGGDHHQWTGVGGHDDPASAGGPAHEIGKSNEQCSSAGTRDLDIRKADLVADGLFK